MIVQPECTLALTQIRNTNPGGRKQIKDCGRVLELWDKRTEKRLEVWCKKRSVGLKESDSVYTLRMVAAHSLKKCSSVSFSAPTRSCVGAPVDLHAMVLGQCHLLARSVGVFKVPKPNRIQHNFVNQSLIELSF